MKTKEKITFYADQGRALPAAGAESFFVPLRVKVLGALAALSLIVVLLTAFFASSLLDDQRPQFAHDLLIAASSLVLFIALASWFVTRLVTVPVERLYSATRLVAHGKFDVHVNDSARDEIGKLSKAFNRMADELRDRDAQLVEAQAALIHSAKMAAFGELGAGIAHEVRNPLTGILGYAQLAQRKLASDDAASRYLQTIEKETRRCISIVASLLRFARQEKLAKENIDINAIITDAIDIIDHQIIMSGTRIETDFAAELPAVFGNGNQLQQVVMNLAINAAQAIDGAHGCIWLRTQLDGDYVRVLIQDDGPGIPNELRAQIFEPFFTTKPAGTGTGLGLSVTYGIVEDHGGDIDVESVTGVGTSFIVRLPLVAVEKAEVKFSLTNPAGAAA